MQLPKTMAMLGGAWLLVYAAAGCATKGFVRDQVAALTARDGEIQATAERAGTAAQNAKNTADAATRGVDSARQLALGWTDHREVARHSVYFAFDSAELDAKAQEVLNMVAEELELNPNYVVSVFGFADPTGPDAYNVELGRRRAESVARYLAGDKRGSLERIRVLSFGENIPEYEVKAIGESAKRRQALLVLLERVPAGDKRSLSQR
jgi:outer membrane protein OmpA-like peptidoglycan-associated protein